MKKKRINTLNDYYKSIFNTKVVKISINANMTCPNRDGSKGYGGCSFCTTTPFIGDFNEPILTQFENVKNLLSKKWKDAKYIAFLEYGSNTYADVSKLKEIYEPLLCIDDVVGLSIATRCDCLNDDILNYLCDLNKRTFLTVELGLESSNNDTLKLINRGHTKEDFIDAVIKLKRRNIRVVAHIINGLPNDTEEDMINTIRLLNDLKVDGIKFHMLYIDKQSRMYSDYLNKPFHILTMDEYISILSHQISILDKDIVIHRLVSGPSRLTLFEPTWLNHKFLILNSIDKYLEEHDIYQGCSL